MSSMPGPWTVAHIDLSDLDFWGLPFDDRLEAFRALRRERPVTFFEEAPLPLLPQGPGYWAVTRHADVVAVSRDSSTFSSARGSVIPDLPPGPPFSYMGSA
jgi:cytochrome P450